MSPGQAAYEARKAEKRRLKMDQEEKRALRERREEQGDATVDALFVAVQAFIKGEAGFVVTDTPIGKVVTFGSLPKA